jgi:pimeloyl-ACP methyl ester carboxylesterase
MVTEIDLELADGAVVHAYDTSNRDRDERLPVFWHHGTPNVGEPPEPLFPAAVRLGLRWVSYDRPGYGQSTPRPGRNVASAARDVSAVADALGIEHFAVMGHSGGGPHALACAALLPDRVVGAISVAGLAPFDAEGLDWFGGMAAGGAASLRAAAAGREAKQHHEGSGTVFAPDFTVADLAMLAGEWSWLGEVAAKAVKGGLGGLVDDDLAYVAPWGFDPADISAPVLLLHGERDRVAPVGHSRWLAARCPCVDLWLGPDDGHLSILDSAAAALDWLREHLRVPR